jgi:hypothetical protein
VARRYSNLNPGHLPSGFKDILRWGVLDRLFGKHRPSIEQPVLQTRRPPQPGGYRMLGELLARDFERDLPA